MFRDAAADLDDLADMIERMVVNDDSPRPGRKPRKDEVSAYLASVGGSATRGQIMEGTGIPRGTLATLLVPPEFVREDGGLYRHRGSILAEREAERERGKEKP